MKLEIAIIFFVGFIVLSAIGWVVHKRVPRKPRTHQFTYSWKELQLFCKNPQTWHLALEAADNLLDKALKVKRFRGKSMGERLVDAQRSFSNNDGVWYAHNLCKKALGNDDFKFTEKEIKRALISFRQALKDLGALEGDRPADA